MVCSATGFFSLFFSVLLMVNGHKVRFTGKAIQHQHWARYMCNWPCSMESLSMPFEFQ